MHLHSLHFINPPRILISLIPINTYTAFISLFIIPPHLYTYISYYYPTYTYTAYINTHKYLHSLYLIIPPHLYTYISYYYPTYIYTAYISLLPHIYLHSLHLINPPHIPTQPSCSCTRSYPLPTTVTTDVKTLDYRDSGSLTVSGKPGK